MKVSLFHYRLPEELIAQYPLLERDRSRLMVVERSDGSINHQQFYELPRLINDRYLLVINDTRVIPARLEGRRLTGGKVEVFLVREAGEERWICLVRPARKLRKGAEVLFADGLWRGWIEEEVGLGERLIRFEGPNGVRGLMERLGQVPLPPYIKRAPEKMDRERYQTIFARENGAVAAPTAGLHFTPKLIQELEKRGIEMVSITLHVGPGTFRPVKSEEVEQHRMESEYYRVSREAAEHIEEGRAAGKRVLAVGTTVTRALESSVDERGRFVRAEGWTDLFIYPGYKFKLVEALLTNFHLPKSSLLMLVCAFGGIDLIMSAYREAVRERYRFYSYGDAMLVS